MKGDMKVGMGVGMKGDMGGVEFLNGLAFMAWYDGSQKGCG